MRNSGPRCTGNVAVALWSATAAVVIVLWFGSTPPTLQKQHSTTAPTAATPALNDAPDQIPTIPLPAQIKKFWSQQTPEPVVPTFSQLVQHIHGSNPYVNFPNFSKRTPLPSPWTQLTEDVVHQVLQLLPSKGKSPLLVVEVGSFVGGSAKVWGKTFRWSSINATILCIDTWQGTLTQWLLRDNLEYLKPEFGHSTLFDLFMVNIMDAKLEDMVLPLPVPAAVGGPFLKARKYIIDIVYLDSSHEVMETFKEVCTFWEVLQVGGVLLGDDYHGFPGVRHDVDMFVEKSKAKLTHIGNQWYIQKTPDVANYVCYQWQ